MTEDAAHTDIGRFSGNAREGNLQSSRVFFWRHRGVVLPFSGTRVEDRNQLVGWPCSSATKLEALQPVPAQDLTDVWSLRLVREEQNAFERSSKTIKKQYRRDGTLSRYIVKQIRLTATTGVVDVRSSCERRSDTTPARDDVLTIVVDHRVFSKFPGLP